MRYLLHDVFTESVKTNPESISIVQENGISVSYSELNRLSNRFANLFLKLKDNNFFDKPYIGIISSVHIESIAAVIGCLKIGCAYVPLDEHSPTERLKHIIDNTNLDVIVVDACLYNLHKDLFTNQNITNVVLINNNCLENFEDTQKVIFINNEINDSEPVILNQVSDDLAYILHSSGSTGIPKGIMLSHRNARTFVDWMQKEFKLHSTDVIASRAPFKFDLSVFDIFNTFKVGAKLVCFDWNKVRDSSTKHEEYVALLERFNVTILYTTPSTFISLMNKGKLGILSNKLRLLLYAGEPFPVAKLKKLMINVPNAKVANIYGPTETNIITYYWINKLPDQEKPIPLGHVVDDTNIIIVSDNQDMICEPNQIGEIWCRGGTVTQGYLGMEDKTKDSLVKSPFHHYPAYYWRTGDYGYRDGNGLLHYKGRRDHMLKVKGYRIELGEVESAISLIDEIDELSVVAIPDDKYGNRLYCFYSVIKNKNLEVFEIKLFLSKKIPDYMMPFEFIKLEELPKTSSGKVDRLVLASLINNI